MSSPTQWFSTLTTSAKGESTFALRIAAKLAFVSCSPCTSPPSSESASTAGVAEYTGFIGARRLATSSSATSAKASTSSSASAVAWTGLRREGRTGVEGQEGKGRGSTFFVFRLLCTFGVSPSYPSMAAPEPAKTGLTAVEAASRMTRLEASAPAGRGRAVEE